jgi:hypothetical protein
MTLGWGIIGLGRSANTIVPLADAIGRSAREGQVVELSA